MTNTKGKLAQFAASELVVCLLQSAIFFLVITFISNFFHDEASLASFIESKLGDLTIKEFWLTCLSVVLIAGLLTTAEKIVSNFDKELPIFLNNAINKALLEIPKTFYLLASSIGVLGMTFSAVVANYKLLVEYLVIWIAFFSFGCILSFLLTPKHSLGDTHE